MRDYVREAVEVGKAGLKVTFEQGDLVFPAELVHELDERPDLKTAFEALTSGRRKGYILRFSRAKRSETRAGRIDESAPQILEGKSPHDR